MMGLPLGELKKNDLVQYKDPGIDNAIYRVEGVTYRSSGRDNAALDRVRINGTWVMSHLLERPHEGMAKDEPIST